MSSSLSSLKDFPYTAEEQRREAEVLSSRLSIQGVQPKLSVALDVKKSLFRITDRGGRYILKPQVERYKHLPENEDLTMRLASVVGIEVPLHGLIYSKDGTFAYVIRRFDRKGQKSKLHVEDFAQLSGESRDTKYRSSMEKVASMVDQYCTFPVVEKLKLFKRTLFSFIVGNGDMHLKNFSVIVRDGKVELSPAYDLVNSSLVITKPKDELAIPIRGKRAKLNREDLIDYFGIDYLGVAEPLCQQALFDFKASLPKWKELVGRSFLPEKDRVEYLNLVEERMERLGLSV